MLKTKLKNSLSVLNTSIRRLGRLILVPYWIGLESCYGIGLRNHFKIPVIINNFNRLTSLVQLITFLESKGYQNIIILDNDSTYPPLLKFYAETKHKLINLNHNYGHLALWKSGVYKEYWWDYFCYTDSDVLPISECPNDFLRYFRKILRKYYSLDKVGFAIKVDDLPDSFSLKEKVAKYESRYWQQQLEPGIFDAPIDTTFAMYRPFSNLRHQEIYTLPAARIGFPYLIRHLPWYVDSENLSDEESYYLRTCNKSSSIAKSIKGEGAIY